MVNKKGDLTLYYIIGLLILIALALIVWKILLSEEGLISKVGEASKEQIEGSIPGGAKIPDTQIEIAENIETAYDELIDILEENKDKIGPCFFQYNKLPDLDKNSIKLSSKDGILTISLNNDLGQQVTWRQINGLELCVVAGKGRGGITVAENFYKNYLEGTMTRINTDDFIEVSEVVLRGDEDNLDYFVEGVGVVNGQRENNQLLYIPEKGKLCFLPTFDGDIFGICSSDSDGLDDDCLNANGVAKLKSSFGCK